MKIKVLFSAMFREKAGVKELSIEMEKGEQLGDLLSKLNARYGRGFSEILNLESGEMPDDVLILVNGTPTRSLDLELKDGDTVLLTVAIAGGGPLEVRCLNCLKRVKVEVKAKEAKCPNCGLKFTLTWVSPTQPKIERILEE
ncbi:MAG: hypothetical protein DRJ98_07130 [Thermoprotei archaeon]|nr:MAG: hypothetical protein DRJ98_07130 [Thermoprotei archaeon]RLF17302.1 MAG: hypothetical protein DRN06_04040 [Thermoprotei archaeon]